MSSGNFWGARFLKMTEELGAALLARDFAGGVVLSLKKFFELGFY
jgi:hypothetical protein